MFLLKTMLLIVGLTTSYMGIRLELSDGWEKLPFTTNIVSSIAAGSLGLWLSIVVFQRVASGVLRNQQRDAAANLRVRAATSMGETIAKWATNPDGTELERAVIQSMDDLEEEVRLFLQDDRLLYPTGGDEATTLVELTQEHLLAVARSSKNQANVMQRSVRARHDVHDQWAAMREGWRFLRDHVKVEAFKTGDRWAEGDDESIINNLLEGDRVLGDLSGFAMKAQYFAVRHYQNFQVSTTPMNGDFRADLYLAEDKFREHWQFLQQVREECADMKRFREACRRVVLDLSVGADSPGL